MNIRSEQMCIFGPLSEQQKTTKQRSDTKTFKNINYHTLLSHRAIDSTHPHRRCVVGGRNRVEIEELNFGISSFVSFRVAGSPYFHLISNVKG